MCKRDSATQEDSKRLYLNYLSTEIAGETGKFFPSGGIQPPFYFITTERPREAFAVSPMPARLRRGGRGTFARTNWRSGRVCTRTTRSRASPRENVRFRPGG